MSKTDQSARPLRPARSAPPGRQRPQRLWDGRATAPADVRRPRGGVGLALLWVLALGVLMFIVLALASRSESDSGRFRAAAAESRARLAMAGGADGSGIDGGAVTLAPAGGLDGHAPPRESAVWRLPLGGAGGSAAVGSDGLPIGTDGVPIDDPTADPARPFANWCGPVGAWLAWQGFGHLGIGVWLPVALAGTWLVMRAGRRRPPGLGSGSAFIVTLFVLIGLVGFDPFDPPGRLAAPVNELPGNWGGSLGAAIGWELLYALGPGVVIGVLILMGYAVAALRLRTPRHLMVRVAGVLLMVVTISALRYVFWPAAGPFPEGSGGLIPMAVAETLMDRFNAVGTAIILAMGLGLGAIVAIDDLLLAIPRVILYGVLALGRVPVADYAGRVAAAGAGLGRGAGAVLTGAAGARYDDATFGAATTAERARGGRLHDLDDELDEDGIPIAGTGGGATEAGEEDGWRGSDGRRAGGGVMSWLRRVWWREAEAEDDLLGDAGADDAASAAAADRAGGDVDGTAGTPHGRDARLRVNGRSSGAEGRGSRGGSGTVDGAAAPSAIDPGAGGIGATTSFDPDAGRPRRATGASAAGTAAAAAAVASAPGVTRAEPASDEQRRGGAKPGAPTESENTTGETAGGEAGAEAARRGQGARETIDMNALREKIRRLPVNAGQRSPTGSGSAAGAAARPSEEDLPRTEDYSSYQFPTLDLLAEPEATFSVELEEYVREQAVALEHALQTYNIDGKVVGIDTGPVITMYEIELAPGTKVASINSISSDIARALRAQNIRIVPNIPGKNTIGIEVPNLKKEKVRLMELMTISSQATKAMRLAMFLGKDASGGALTADLTAMPHMLIAGTTGSGKSVCMNSILMSFLYTKRPDELKLILVDPKMVELSMFKDVPHLMCPVVTEMDKAAAILEWGVTKMEERYELLAEAGVRDIATYNSLTWDELKERFEPASELEEAKIPKKLPYIVFVIDELADLIMTHKEVETSIVRIAQKARAVGIHLILATQRPQANVVTGLIKSNMPCRISFQVSSGMDSRIVLDHKGAELLLGQGDMLFLGPHSSELVRAQGTLVSDSEIRKVVRFLKKVAAPSYERQLMTIRARIDEENEGGDEDGLDSRERDPLFCDAVDIVVSSGRGSVSLLQRRLAIGYTRSSRLIDQMGLAGIIGEHRGSQARDVLITPEEWEQMRSMMEAEEAEDTLFAKPETGDGPSPGPGPGPAGVTATTPTTGAGGRPVRTDLPRERGRDFDRDSDDDRPVRPATPSVPAARADSTAPAARQGSAAPVLPGAGPALRRDQQSVGVNEANLGSRGGDGVDDDDDATAGLTDLDDADFDPDDSEFDDEDFDDADFEDGDFEDDDEVDDDADLPPDDAADADEDEVVDLKDLSKGDFTWADEDDPDHRKRGRGEQPPSARRRPSAAADDPPFAVDDE